MQASCNNPTIEAWCSRVGPSPPPPPACRVTQGVECKQPRHYDEVEAQTGGYRTYPVYKNQLIDHWRATQELRVESGDVDRITELVRVLQTRLQLQSVTFSISPEQRETVENELIGEAIGAFKDRAELVRENLGAASYRIVHVGIGTAGTVPAPVQIRAMSAMKEAAAAPALEPGTSTVTVSVEGQLELRN